MLALTREAGFALAGVAQAQASDRRRYVIDWLARGRAGEMAYLARHIELRLDPRKFVPGAQSILCVADRHAPTSEERDDAIATPRGRVARYAWGDDYHKIIKGRLHQLADTLRERWPGQTFRCAVDTAPVMERDHATRAGLGWIGKHTLLIHPEMGSWLLLGVIVTTLPIESEASAAGFGPDASPLAFFGEHFQGCGTCTRCIEACPTQCIDPQGYGLDASRCISYLTIEHRSAIDPSLHPAMGDWIAGCDVCQEVCPYNRRSDTSAEIYAGYQPKPGRPRPNLAAILDWTEQDRRDAFQGAALKRIKLDMLKRNALIALGNTPREHLDAGTIDRIRCLAKTPEAGEMVRETARQVLVYLRVE